MASYVPHPDEQPIPTSLLEEVKERPMKHFSTDELYRILAAMSRPHLDIVIPYAYKALKPQIIFDSSVDKQSKQLVSDSPGKFKVVRTEPTQAEQQTKRLRVTLNKVSQQNLNRLCHTLSDIVQDADLSYRLVHLIFDRVASECALAELYAQLVKALQQNLEVNRPGSSQSLLSTLSEVAEKRICEHLEKGEEGLIGHACLVTQLFICDLLDPSFMILVYDALLSDVGFSADKLEAFCHLFLLTYEPVRESNPKEANDICRTIAKLRYDTRISKRVQYMVREVFEEGCFISSHLTNPAPIEKPSTLLESAAKPEVQEEQTEETTSQKARISPEVKVQLT
jgi:hypothetical protein